jgi:hypothetical protein
VRSRSRTRREGNDYQDVAAIDLLFRWLGSNAEYKWFEVEADDALSLDDVPTRKSDGTYLSRQVKYSTASEDPADSWIAFRDERIGASTMLKQFFGKARTRLTSALQSDHMRRLGIGNTMALARMYNQVVFGRNQRAREAAYRNGFDELLRENGPPQTPRIRLEDGWGLDTTHSLPHLEQLLNDADAVIAARSGALNPTPGSYRAFFQDILRPEDLETYPSFLNFVLSSDVLIVVSDYLECIPVLSATLPRGVRFVESSLDYDGGTRGAYRESQLFHIDYYSKPDVYVIVLLRDVTIENGPFSFMPISTSRKAADALHYWARGVGYRLSDEQVYSVVPRSELKELTYPRGTVLYIDPSQCLHFGSRDAVKPRFMMMYGLTTACRNDLSEFWYEQFRYPIHEGDSRLRRMVLDKSFVE